MNNKYSIVYEEYRTNSNWNFTEDILQEGLIVYMNKYIETPEKDILKLVFAICKNIELSQYQKNKKRSEILDELANTPSEFPHIFPQHQETLDITENKINIRECQLYHLIEYELSTTHLEVFRAYFNRLCKQKELAEKLGVTQSYISKIYNETITLIIKHYNITEKDIKRITKTYIHQQGRKNKKWQTC